MACSKPSISPSISRCTSKDNHQITLVNHGHSSMHPVHVGQSFCYSGVVHRSMLAALKMEEARVKGDKVSELMAIEYSHNPARLKTIEVCSVIGGSDEAWTKVVQQASNEIAERYADANPDCVSEILSTIGSSIVIKGPWEPSTLNVTKEELEKMDRKSAIQGKNHIGDYFTSARIQYMRADQERQPKYHYSIENIGDTASSETIGGFSNNTKEFLVTFHTPMAELDGVMHKRILCSVIDTLLAHLNQKSAVKLTMGCGGKATIEECKFPPEIARPGLALIMMEFATVDELIEHGLSIQALQLVRPNNRQPQLSEEPVADDAARKRPAVKMTNDTSKKQKGKGSAGKK